MRLRRTGTLALVATVVALAAPASALAHAALLRTSPSASVTVNHPPKEVDMTFSEAVEPEFATVSVTNPAAQPQSAGRPRRSPTDPDTLVTPLEPNLAEGWYLVYWRVISADGHPVKGAFVFAVGPNPGPQPAFRIPSLTESAATPPLLVARWLMFISAMAAIGLFLLRSFVVRDIPRRARGASLRPVSTAFWASILVALVVTPVYDAMSTATFAQASVWNLGTVVPLLNVSHFGHALLDFEIVLALLAVAGGLAIWLDAPERRKRSVAALLALLGALGAAGAALLVPGLAGHAAQTSPRWLSLGLDWLHLAAGSIWIGGLVGLLVLGFGLGELRVQALTATVPRFSRLAFATVMALVGSGIGSALQHFPTFGSLWDTSYGQSLVLKLGFLGATIAIAAVNFTRTAPRFVRAAAGEVGIGASTASLLRILVSGEVLLVVGAFFGAALLTSLPPPPKALASLGSINANVGRNGDAMVKKNGYELRFRFTPNRAAVPNTFAVQITKNGEPVRGADVTARFTMLDMEMQQQAYNLPEHSPGGYARANTPALVMVGRWGISFDIRPRGSSAPLDVLLLDHAVG